MDISRCKGCGAEQQPESMCSFVIIEIDWEPYTWKEADEGERDEEDTVEMSAWLCERCVTPLRELQERVNEAEAKRGESDGSAGSRSSN